MRSVELSTASLSGFFDAIEKSRARADYLYRGHGDVDWKLTPSLYRLDRPFVVDRHVDRYSETEKYLVNRFFEQAMPYLLGFARSRYADRALAQHFGVPTSLLDWSRDPLVALYFAVEGCCELGDQGRECDAAVYMTAPGATLTDKDNEYSFDDDIIAISPPVVDARVVAQKSVFTLQRHVEELGKYVPLDDRPSFRRSFVVDDDEKFLTEITIKRECVPELRYALYGMGFDRRSMFPGMDGVGQALAARAKLGLWDL